MRKILRRVGDSDASLMRDTFLDPSRRDVDRNRERPRNVVDSPEGICLVVTVKKGAGLRRRLRPRWSASADDMVKKTSVVSLSVPRV
jgi:hypothetical protein